MNPMEEAEMELGLESGELAGTFPPKLVERVLRPIYGPWRIYTREEEERMIMESLARENERSRNWEARRADRRAIDALERDIVERNL